MNPAMRETVPDDARARMAESEVERAVVTVLCDREPVEELVDAVCAFTDTFRAQGEPVERVLVRLKDVVRRSEAHAFRQTATYADRVDSITTAAVRRCIEHFYRDVPRNE